MTLWSLSKQQRHILLVVVFTTLAKVLAIPALNSSTWLGSDGESYLAIASDVFNKGLLNDSEQMVQWNGGGYSILIAPLFIFGQDGATRLFILLQTVLFATAVAYLCGQILHTRLSRFAVPAAYVIMLNPTLTLSSLQVGYESPTASLHIIIMALSIADLRRERSGFLSWRLLMAAFLVSLNAGMQPRFALSGGAALVVWAFARVGWRRAIPVVVASAVVALIIPVLLTVRTSLATGEASVGSNFGGMMRMGAGPNATGTYFTSDTGVPCDIEGLSPNQASNAQVGCVIEWNLANPGSALRLAFMKSVYLWSPWWGPLAGGTEARNLYLKFHPVRSLISTQPQLDLVMGSEGKLISWLWVLGAWVALAIGALALWRLGLLERAFMGVSISIVASAWIVSLMTIGDHRHRVPIMGATLMLQFVGLAVLAGRGKLSLGHHRTLSVFQRPEPTSGAHGKRPQRQHGPVSVDSSKGERVGGALSKSQRKKR